MVQGGLTMTTWSKDELRKIAEADGLNISPFRSEWNGSATRNNASECGTDAD